MEYVSDRQDENLSDTADEDATVVIPFQNENLCAYLELRDGTRKVDFFKKKNLFLYIVDELSCIFHG